MVETLAPTWQSITHEKSQRMGVVGKGNVARSVGGHVEDLLYQLSLCKAEKHPERRRGWKPRRAVRGND